MSKLSSNYAPEKDETIYREDGSNRMSRENPEHLKPDVCFGPRRFALGMDVGTLRWVRQDRRHRHDSQ